MSDLREAGFKERTRIAEARDRLLDTPPIDRTERLSLSVVDGRTLAEPVEAIRNVPHYARAAMDGYAVRADRRPFSGSRTASARTAPPASTRGVNSPTVPTRS